MYRALQLKKLHKGGNRNEHKNSWYFASHSSKKGKSRKRRMAKIYCKGTQGSRRVNGSICELKVNPRQNQQQESRARPPSHTFEEGFTEIGYSHTLHQG